MVYAWRKGLVRVAVAIGGGQSAMLAATMAMVAAADMTTIEASVGQADGGYASARRLVYLRRLDSSSDGYSFMFYFVIGTLMLTCLVYHVFFRNRVEASFIQQQALPETILRQDVIAR